MTRLFATALIVFAVSSSTAWAGAAKYEWLGNTVPKAVAAKLTASCPAFKDLTVAEPEAMTQEESDRETGVFRIRFSPNKIVYGASCDLAASNVWWAAALVEGSKVTRLNFPMLNDSGKMQSEPQVGGLLWDGEKGVLRSGLLSGCAGANQHIAEFKLNGHSLELVYQETTDAGENCDKPVTKVLYNKRK